MIKYATCKKCGWDKCVWVFSAKGKWYLSEPDSVSTSFGGNKTIPFAHKCHTAEFVDYKNFGTTEAK